MRIGALIHKFWETFKSFGPLGPLMIFTVAAPGLGAIGLISTSQNWFPYLESLGSTQVLVYIACAIVLAGLSLIPTHACSLIAGMMFGIVKGPLLALVAVVGASYLSLIIVSLLVKESSYQALLQKPQAAKVHEELLVKSGSKAILFISMIRLSPVMPFAATNVLLAVSRVKAHLFILGSLIGLAPRVIIVAVAGAGLTELDFSKGSNIWLGILGVLSTIFLLGYTGRIVKKFNH